MCHYELFNLLFGANKLQMPNDCFAATFFTRNQYLALVVQMELNFYYLFIIFYHLLELKDVFLLHWLELLLWIRTIKHKRDQNISKKDHFNLPSKLTSPEYEKSVESKEANHLADKTFSLVNIGSVICFPMSIGTKFELEVVSADDNLLVL